MELIAQYGKEDLATLYLARLRGHDRYLVEFVESVQPPHPRGEKWVLIVSSGFGCPVRCAICDAGNHFHGWLTADEILAQTDFLVERRFPDRRIPSRKFKIQFARMGEPAMNTAVLSVLEELPKRYDAPGLVAVVSTIAPRGSEEFFASLLDIKGRHYPDGQFRLQFSIHSTDDRERATLVRAATWRLQQIADYGTSFFRDGDAKVCLNFAAVRGVTIAADTISEIFDPCVFVVKFTPVNPTDQALRRRFVSVVGEGRCDPAGEDLIRSLKERGFDVIVSIGELEENAIGTNCGQMVTRYVEGRAELADSYPSEGYRSGHRHKATGFPLSRE